MCIMPSLHLVYDELTAIVRCINSHFRAISVRRSYDIVRFLGRSRVVVASTILFMLRLHLPRSSYDLFVYNFPYGFQVS